MFPKVTYFSNTILDVLYCVIMRLRSGAIPTLGIAPNAITHISQTKFSTFLTF